MSDFEDMMAHTITVEPYSGQNNYGEATYGAAVTYKARVQMKSEWIRDVEGREVRARGRAYVSTTTVLGAKDRLTLPSQFTPTQPPILDVHPAYDEDTLHHVVLMLG